MGRAELDMLDEESLEMIRIMSCASQVACLESDLAIALKPLDTCWQAVGDGTRYKFITPKVTTGLSFVKSAGDSRCASLSLLFLSLFHHRVLSPAPSLPPLSL